MIVYGFGIFLLGVVVGVILGIAFAGGFDGEPQ